MSTFAKKFARTQFLNVFRYFEYNRSDYMKKIINGISSLRGGILGL